MPPGRIEARGGRRCAKPTGDRDRPRRARRLRGMLQLLGTGFSGAERQDAQRHHADVFHAGAPVHHAPAAAVVFGGHDDQARGHLQRQDHPRRFTRAGISPCRPHGGNGMEVVLSTRSHAPALCARNAAPGLRWERRLWHSFQADGRRPVCLQIMEGRGAAEGNARCLTSRPPWPHPCAEGPATRATGRRRSRTGKRTGVICNLARERTASGRYLQPGLFAA